MGGLNAMSFKKIWFGLVSVFAYWIAMAGIVAASYALGWGIEVPRSLDLFASDSIINGLMAPVACLHLLAVIAVISGLSEAMPASNAFRYARRWYLVQLVCSVLTTLCDGIFVALSNRGVFSDAQQQLFLAYYIVLLVITLFGILASDWMGCRNLLQGYQQVCWSCGVEDSRTAELSRTSRRIDFSSALLMGSTSLVVMALPVLYLHASSRYAPPGQLSTFDIVLIGTVALCVVASASMLLRALAQLRVIRHALNIYRTVNELSD